jgi:ABC-2 type transport system ATP-binding protein
MITISGLTKTFDRRAVLDAIDLAIGDGDRIALVGSNGAGKTTLFRCLLGHYHYDGSIAFNGERPTRRDEAVLARIAFVPQLPPPLRMPVGELVRFAESSAGAKADRMTEISQGLGLDLAAVAHQPFNRLSGGQKQKVLVTIALARAADLFIFDEPAANLDPAARATFIDLLAARQDAAMIIASHRLEEVAPLVNRVIELDRGRIVLDDVVADKLTAGDARHCMVRLSAAHEPFARALAQWGLNERPVLTFSGTIPAADYYRFLGMISRYASVVEAFEFGTAAAPRKPARGKTDVS